MEDFRNFSYADTLKMLDSWYDHDTENVNYAQVLLGMKDCDSISSCMKVYKRVYQKYMSYMNTTELSGHKSFDEDLNTCLNENILRLLKDQGRDIDYDFANSCLANLRQCKDIKKHQSDWLRLVQRDDRISNVLMTADKIKEAQKKYEKARDEFLYSHYDPGTNGFKRVKGDIVDNLSVLKQYGYKKLPYDINFLFSNNTQIWIVMVIIVVAIILIFREALFGIFLLIGLGSVMLSILKWAKG